MAVLNGQIVGGGAPVPDAATSDMPVSAFADNNAPAPMDVVNEISKQLTGQPLGDLASNVGQTAVDTAKTYGNAMVHPIDFAQNALSGVHDAVVGTNSQIPATPAQVIPPAPAPQPGPHDEFIKGIVDTHAKHIAGGGYGGPKAEALKLDTKDLEEGVAKQNEAAAKLAEAQMAVADAEHLVNKKRLDNELDIAQKKERIENNINASTDRQLQALQETEDEILKQNTTIDPDRWMHSRTPGQLFAMVLANGLTQGRAWQQFQAAIDTDIRAQQQSYENRRGQIKDKAENRKSMYALYRERGLDQRQALLASQAAANQMFDLQFQMAGDSTKNEIIKQNALAASGKLQVSLGDSKNKIVQTVKESAQKDAELQERAREANLQAQVQREATAARMAAAASKGATGGKLLPPPLLKEINNADTALNGLSRLIRNAPKGMGDTFLSNFTKYVPGTKAQKFDLMRKAFTNELVRLSQTDAPSAAEYKVYIDQIGNTGDINLPEKLQTVYDMMLEKRNTQLGNDTKAGYNTSGFTGGEQLPSDPDTSSLQREEE